MLANSLGPGVVILNDVALSGARLTQLTQFIERGGGLLVVLGERAAWAQDSRDLLPGFPGGIIDHSSGRGAIVGELDYSHPIFELFKAPRSGDFSSARFFRHRSVTVDAGPRSPGTTRAGADAVRVLARFDDGTPALTEKAIGRGRVALWSSTLDNFWNDLVLRPVFVPFLHQAVRYLARFQERTDWVTVGQIVDTSTGMPGLGSRGMAAPALVLTPSGERVPTAGGERAGSFEFAEPGFFEFHAGGGDADGSVVIAANVDPAESDLSMADPEEFVAAITGRAGGASGSSDNRVPPSSEEQERRQSVWRYLLVAGILILGVESVLSNRLTRAS